MSNGSQRTIQLNPEPRHTRFNACARLALVEDVKQHYTSLGGWKQDDQVPIVYSDLYNISFFGLEKLHPFDAGKFGQVAGVLQRSQMVAKSQWVRPAEASEEVLLDVHTPEYLRQLHGSSKKVAQVTELAPLAILPNRLVQHKVMRPMRFHVGGTMLAAALALQHGWAINLGGGMHHACFEDGSGWCPYSDIILALRKLRVASSGAIKKAMVIDLDVHQGNGVERDKLHFGDEDLYILDAYNREQWPQDEAAKAAINEKLEFMNGTTGEQYLTALRPSLHKAFAEFQPDIVIYNAGTDILAKDPLGNLRVSCEDVVARDQMVFGYALEAGVPIVMVLSGGYLRASHEVIARSIANLFGKFRLLMPWKDTEPPKAQ